MPDRDNYNKNVDKGWQTGARFAHTFDVSDVVLDKLVRPIHSYLRNGTCPAFAEMIDIGTGTLEMSEARDALEKPRRDGSSLLTDVVAETVLAHMAAHRLQIGIASPSVARSTADDLKLALTARCIVSLVRAKIAPPCLRASFAKKNVEQFTILAARRERNLDALRQSQEVMLMAKDLLMHPASRLSTKIRTVPKMSQEDLVNLAVGD